VWIKKSSQPGSCARKCLNHALCDDIWLQTKSNISRDVARLHQETRLMFDFVCNHMSSHSAWFRHFLAQELIKKSSQPGSCARKCLNHALCDDIWLQTKSNISLPPATDLSAVTRPRTSPLLTPFQMADGETRFIWTTFSVAGGMLIKKSSQPGSCARKCLNHALCDDIWLQTKSDAVSDGRWRDPLYLDHL
jgi:hypothetical protein